ncbi:MAG: hypothetical protein JXJ04_21845, partial [Spirochaetales bacterium]|nr:hypothetical protein [Spirochaetales bacterium]
MVRKNYIFLTIIVILVLYSCMMFLLSCNKNKTWKNPHEYGLDEFLRVDPELVCYEEAPSIPLPFESPRGIAVDPDGLIYAAGDENLLVIKEDGEITDRLELGRKVYSLAASAAGIVYIGYVDYIEKINMKTKERNEWAFLGEDACITSLALGDNYLFAADAGDHSVLCFTKDGTLISRITGEDDPKEPYFIIPSPYFDIAAGTDDTFWIVNPGRHRIEHWSAAGESLKKWGSPGSDIGEFCGCCNPVHIALLPGNTPESKYNFTFVTAEKGIPRIKLYSPGGEFIC